MGSPENPTETLDRVKRALAGDRAAQRLLGERLSPIIRARIARRLKAAGRHDTATAEDLAQDVWSKLFDPKRPLLAQWQTGGRSLESYVGQAAEWMAAQRIREWSAQKRQVDAVDLSPELAAEVDVEGDVLGADLARRLFAELRAELPPIGQRVLELSYGDQMTPNEIAGALGVNRQVVDNWKHRIRKRAAALLEDGDLRPPEDGGVARSPRRSGEGEESQ